MKHSTLIATAILGLLALGTGRKAEAAPMVYQSARGLGVSIGQCFVQFDPNGQLLQGGQKCDDVQLHEAKKAVQSYLRQHGGGTGSQPRVYQSARGLGVLIDDCFVQFDHNGNLLEGGQKCDDIQLNTARNAVRNYRGN